MASPGVIFAYSTLSPPPLKMEKKYYCYAVIGGGGDVVHFSGYYGERYSVVYGFPPRGIVPTITTVMPYVSDG